MTTTSPFATDSVAVGHSARMRAVFEFVRVISNSDSTVVITGESGTGKEVTATMIHENRTVERLGGTRTIPVNVRVLAGTKRDLKQMVAEGKFREERVPNAEFT